MRRRSTAYRAEAALPPTRVVWWTSCTAMMLLLSVAWSGAVLDIPSFLGGVVDPASSTVRVAVASGVLIFLLVDSIYAYGRLRIERLARDPGPLLILAFKDYTGASGENSHTGERLQAAFQHHLLATRLRGITAIPSPGRATDFIHVIERAAESSPGIASVFMRLVRFLAPVSSYEVQCTMLGVDTLRREQGERPCTLLVELMRSPRAPLTPETFVARTWEQAVEAAAEWTASVVLPRTRICQEPPWTLWQGQAIPVKLFSLFLRFQRDRDARRLDEAMEALHDALELDPNNLGLRLEKGKLEEQLGMPLDALATYSWIVGQAARRDRRLAYLWFGPPEIAWDTDGTSSSTPNSSAVASGEENGGSSDVPLRRRAWHFHPRGVPGLDVWHPVVYVARYRYCLLLGLGEALAEQWWMDSRITSGDGARACASHRRSARSAARGDAREVLRRRLLDRHGDRPGELARRLKEKDQKVTPAISLVSTPAHRFLSETAGNRNDTATLVADAAVFFTSLGVWEIEHLLAERSAVHLGPSTWRALRSVLPYRSLLLVLPRAILLKALCLHRLHRNDEDSNQSRKALVGRAAASMVFPLNEPVLEPDLRDLLSDGWPAKIEILERWIDKIMKPDRRRLGSWHEHYNVACVLSTLLESRSGGAGDADVARRIARAAVTELEKAVARGYSTAMSAESDWILNEDPDLDALRRTSAFEEFERIHLGLAEGRPSRGFGPVDWQQQTTLNYLLHNFAMANYRAWDERAKGELPIDGSLVASWCATEREDWGLVWDLVRDYDDWRTRLAVSRHMRERTGSRVDTEPRFSVKTLRSQISALAPRVASSTPGYVAVSQARDPAAVQSAIESVVTGSQARLRYLHLLFDNAPIHGGCRPLVEWVAEDIDKCRVGPSSVRSNQETPNFDPTTLQALWRRFSRRWAELAKVFDDGRPAPDTWTEYDAETTARARVDEFSQRLGDLSA